MGMITVTIEGTTVGTVATGGGVVLKTSVSETDSARLIQAYATTYADQWFTTDANGKKTAFQPTYQQILQAWWNGIVAGSIASVRNVEKAQAAKSAADAVASITATTV